MRYRNPEIGNWARHLPTALLLVVFTALPLAHRQVQPPQRFKSGVELVVLDVSVLDRDRRPVRGMKAADFTVLEDGQLQAVSSFQAVDIEDPIPATPPAPWVTEVAPDVQKNTDVNDKRLVVIVLDDAAPMPVADVLHLRPLARDLVGALGPGDLAAVVFARDKRAGQPFTQDRSRLLAAVDRFNGTSDASVSLDAQGDPARGYFDSFNVTDIDNYFSVVRTLRGVFDSMAALPGRRKAVAFISTGIPLDDGFGKPVTGGPAVEIMNELEQAFRVAQRANVNVYPLDPGGLRAPNNMAAGTRDPDNPGFYNREFLKAVAGNTGGFAVVDTNDAMPGIRQALRENASYYLLGYVSSNASAAGRHHRIQVRVTTPGVTVRTRTGHFEAAPPGVKAASKARPAAADAVLEGLLPKTDLTMHLAAVPLANPGKRKATLALVVGLIQRSPRRVTSAVQEIDLRVDAYSPDGRRRSSRKQTIPVTLKGPGGGMLVGYELLSSIELDPGRYHLRVAAESRVRGVRPRPGVPGVGLFDPEEDLTPRSGSVYGDVDIPDFLDAPLSLSGLALMMRPAPASGPPKAFAKLLPEAPTTVREFSGGEQVAGLIRISQRAAAPAVPVTLTLHLASAQGATVQERTEQIPASAFAATHTAEHIFEIPVASLPPGEYLLTVKASAGGASATRQLRYTKLR